jgi:two-component system, OmpR family, sensor histidine kinase KdpD
MGKTMVSLRRTSLRQLGHSFEQAIAVRFGRYLGEASNLAPAWSLIRSILLAFALVAGMTLCLLLVTQFVELHHVSSAYLIPVLIAAIRLGIVPAIVAAIGGVGASAFFFYPPIYDFRVENPEQLLDLPLFVIVAAVTGQLAARARAHAVLAQDREGEMRALYAFSKRLAVATDPAQIYSTIQNHLGANTGCRVVYFEAGASPSASHREANDVPDGVLRAVSKFALPSSDRAGMSVYDERTGSSWLVRAVSETNSAFGVVAIDVGRQGLASMQPRIDAVLADAAATLERLDVARAIGEVKLRTEAETLRAALMGSVSHGLRTPLASIMGSASILVQAPAITQDPRLSGLAGIVRDEAERLNSDIQRLLDASTISSAGVRPHMAWVDTAEIIDAALASQRKKLASHRLTVNVPHDLPLVNADQVLIEQALGQVLDNAAKYSPAGGRIDIEARSTDGITVIAIGDQGPGFSPEERQLIFERFYRGPRTSEAVSGSGLGLWIARAFVLACGGTIEAASRRLGLGTEIRITLAEVPMPPAARGGADD